MRPAKFQRVSLHGKGLPGGRSRPQNYYSDSTEPSLEEQCQMALHEVDKHILNYLELLKNDAGAIDDCGNGANSHYAKLTIEDDPEKSKRRYTNEDEYSTSDDPDDAEASSVSDGIHDSNLQIMKLDALRHWISLAGYEDIFDLATAEAEMSRSTLYDWISSLRFKRFWQALWKAVPLRRRVNSEAQKQRADILAILCEPSRQIYLKEWRALIEDNFFRVNLKELSPQTILDFSFSDMYNRILSHTPNLMSLFESLCFTKPHRPMQAHSQVDCEKEESSDDSTDDADVDNVAPFKSSRKGNLQNRQIIRRIVVAVSVLGNASSRNFNLFQTMMGYTLYASRAARRLLGYFNHSGMSVSYNGIRDALRSTSESIRAELRKIAPKGAFTVCCDNCTYSAPVKNERLYNQKTYINDTVGYVVEQPIPEPHFTPEDINYDKLKQLNVKHFLSSPEDKHHFKEAARCMISKILQDFCKGSGYKSPLNMRYDMPRIYQLDPTLRPKFTTLPTYPFDEGQISEMIKVLRETKKDVGLSDKSSERVIILHFGDFSTVRNQKYCHSYMLLMM